MSPHAAGLATTDPALWGTEEEVLVQALRNLWPILSAEGRQTAIDTVNSIGAQ